jgi:SAM-dependent methyltransferase
MSFSVHELRQFYASKPGALIRRLLLRRLRGLWPELPGLRVMGAGYAMPYLRPYTAEAERVFALMPDQLGVHRWPDGEGEKGLVALCREEELPVETESIDRLVVVHGFEHARQPDDYLQELWRVLKSNGRMMLVTPNRLGLWARAEWTPFGHGNPYSHGQVTQLLQHNLFSIERSERALFMPPFRSAFMLRSAYKVENFGRYAIPGLAGLHIIEASKQVYGGIPATVKTGRAARRGRGFAARPGAIPT